MRGDELDGATVQLCCLLASGWPTAVAQDAAGSTGRLSLPVASASVVAVATSPTDDAANAVNSVFLADKSMTSGSHNFFT